MINNINQYDTNDVHVNNRHCHFIKSRPGLFRSFLYNGALFQLFFPDQE